MTAHEVDSDSPKADFLGKAGYVNDVLPGNLTHEPGAFRFFL
jgi:hypothetical protein